MAAGSHYHAVILFAQLRKFRGIHGLIVTIRYAQRRHAGYFGFKHVRRQPGTRNGLFHFAAHFGITFKNRYVMSLTH